MPLGNIVHLDVHLSNLLLLLILSINLKNPSKFHYLLIVEKTESLTTLSQNMASNVRSRMPRSLVGQLELA